MKKIVNHFCIVTLLFCMQIAVGQVNTDLRPAVKSPEVNKFEQYLNMPVNLVSGTPQVSIPIYTLEYGGMSLPISLEYDASGVKVESIASSVGQNWSLNVGGTVSRIVKGAPDEGNPYNWTAQSGIDVDGFYQDYGLTKLNTELNRYPEQVFSAQNVDNKSLQLSKWFKDIAGGLKDSQPDLFYFSTPEGGSKFVFNDNRKVVYLENTDFFVNETLINLNFANDFKSWNILSPNGINYKFGLDNPTGQQGRGNAAETNQVLSINPGGGFAGIANQYIVNSWFLTEMKNNATNSIITLSYLQNNYYQKINNTLTQFTTPCYMRNGAPFGTCFIEESAYYTFATNAMSLSRNSENRVLSSLINSIKAGDVEIRFIYNKRDDLNEQYASDPNAPKKLIEIQVYNKDQCIKKFTFNYTTTVATDSPGFIGSGGAIENVLSQKRFFLNTVTELDCNTSVTSKTHSFTYNQTPLPNRLSFAQDKWGYYNGKTSNTSLITGYNFYADPTLYANRTVAIAYAKAGILEKITYPTKGTVNFEYESNLGATPNDYVFDLTSLGTLVSINSPFDTSGLYYSSTSFVYTPVPNEALSLDATLNYNPINYAGCSPTTSQAAVLTDNTGKIISYISYGDTRVNRPIDQNLLMAGATYTLTVYSYGERSHCYFNTTKITRHAIKPIYEVGGLRVKSISHKDYDGAVAKTMQYTYLEPTIVKNPIKSLKINYSSLDNINTLITTSSNGNPFVSATAIKYLKDYTTADALNFGGQYDNSYYYYVSEGGDPLDINFMGPQITYGTVKETNGNGTTTTVFNRYKAYFELNGFQNQSQFPAPPVFQSILAGIESSSVQTDSNNNAVKSKNSDYNYTSSSVTINAIGCLSLDNGNFGNQVRSYTLQGGQTKTLKTETETTRLGGQDVTTTMDYEYRPDNKHFQPIKTTLTDNAGTQKLITKMYYPDDMTAPYMADLLIQNRKATPIRVETFRGTTATTDKLSEQQTVYAMDATTSNLVLPKSVYAAKFPNYNTPITTPNVGALEKKVTSDLYDASGNLLQFTPDSGVPVTIIWGYNKTQPIAKIEYATYSLVASLVANLQTISDTGTEASLLAALTTFRNTASLSSAMITTYTYIPLVGVSTITDPKGDKITYTYDALNRLKWVKDKDGNILSENQYHYKN